MFSKNGPWFINRHFLFVKRWEPNFVAVEAKKTFSAVWVRLPQLPTKFYDGALLKKIGNSIGTLQIIDACTSATLRERYARLCIQVLLEEPVTTCILIGSHLQQIIYEGEGFLCKNYGRLGHIQSRCPHQEKEGHHRKEPIKDDTISQQNDNQITEEWQTVPFVKKKRSNSKKQASIDHTVIPEP